MQKSILNADNSSIQPPEIEWRWDAFHDLDCETLYAILHARQQVFVLEQKCLYGDIDGQDPRAFHLSGWQRINGAQQLVA